jgi:hypothetical protein
VCSLMIHSSICDAVSEDFNGLNEDGCDIVDEDCSVRNDHLSI